MKSKHLCFITAFVIICLACGPAFAQWTTYQADASHDGYVPVSLNPATLSLLWQRSLATSSLNPVTAANGEVFVSTSGYFSTGMGLQVLDSATGQTKWSKDYGAIYSVNPPAYANGLVYIQNGKGTSGSPYVYAYNANTGAQVFSVVYGAQWESYYAPTICDNTVYVNGGTYGGMYAFDASSGQQKWFLGLSQYDQWTPAVDANYAYGYAGNTVTAINRTTGQVAFQISDASLAAVPYDMRQALALGTQNDAFAIANNKLVCVDLQNKNIKWQSARAFGSWGQATVANGVVYAIDGGKLDAIDELSGDLLWTWTPPSGSLIGTMIATKTHVLASTSDTTYAVDLTSRASVWSYPMGGALALSNRALYIASSTGTLVAIAVLPSAITPVAPSSLSLTITSPTSGASYASITNSINLSGTANELGSSGSVLCTGCLASVTWSNSRGGSGTGFYDSSWNTPTAWSATGIVLQPGDNVITVTATDLWGNTANAVMTVATPVGVSIAITNPTSAPTYSATTTPIGLSGTAGAVLSSGTVLTTAGLASVTWSNNRGGSGTGAFSSPSTTPTTWSITGIVLKPGDNIITVTATDLWGNTTTAVLTAKAPTSMSVVISSPTSATTYSTNATPVALSGTANENSPAGPISGSAALASLTWTNSRGGSGTGTYTSAATNPTTWSIASIALQGGDNVITVTATDVWGNTTTDVITVTWMPGSVGAAKGLASGKMAYVSDAVVTGTTVISGSVFVESADRSSGVRLLTNQALNIGDRVTFTGTVGRVNGEYQLSGVSFLSTASGTPLTPLYMTSYCIGNDWGESLHYVGMNTTGLLVKTSGNVTGTITSQQLFYIDDGGMYQDGVGPVLGLRVHVPVGVTIPRVGKRVVVTGISRVEKYTLTAWGMVNGDWYPSGSILYVPSIWARSASDVQVL